MALYANRPLSEASVTTYYADISTTGSAFVVSPWRGKITRAYSVIGAAITSADASWTMEINGVAVTGVSVVVANASSAPGDVDIGIPTAANYVNEGDTIEFLADGESTTTSPVAFTAVIERD